MLEAPLNVRLRRAADFIRGAEDDGSVEVHAKVCDEAATVLLECMSMLSHMRIHSGECLGDHPKWMAEIDRLLAEPQTQD